MADNIITIVFKNMRFANDNFPYKPLRKVRSIMIDVAPDFKISSLLEIRSFLDSYGFTYEETIGCVDHAYTYTRGDVYNRAIIEFNNLLMLIAIGKIKKSHGFDDVLSMRIKVVSNFKTTSTKDSSLLLEELGFTIDENFPISYDVV